MVIKGIFKFVRDVFAGTIYIHRGMSYAEKNDIERANACMSKAGEFCGINYKVIGVSEKGIHTVPLPHEKISNTK